MIVQVHGKPRLHVSVNLFFGVWPPACATPLSPHPTEMHMRPRVAQLGFPFLSLGVWGSVWQPFRPPELTLLSLYILT